MSAGRQPAQVFRARTDKQGSESEGLAWIEEAWTDMRPKSLQERTEQVRRADV